MPRTDEGGALFTVVNGQIVPANKAPAAPPPRATPADVPVTVDGNKVAQGGYTDANGVFHSWSDAGLPQPNGSGGVTYPWQAGYTKPQTAQTDYSSFLNIYGLPNDVQAKVNQIFASTPDLNQATALAMAYVRGTQWYAQTYPGIQEGISRGVIANEADYRNYLNNVNQLTKQYLGRDVGGSEIADFLKQGFSVDRVGRIYQGGAIAQTYGPDWRYLSGAFDQNAFTPEETAALGQEQAGIDTPLGQKVQRRVDLAKQRMAAAFGGSTASTSLSLQGGLLSSPGLAAGRSASDIAA